MPIWIYLPFAGIETRRGALWMIWCNILCCLYCIPWSQYIADVPWISRLFLIEGWLWFAVMVAITLWSWVALKWIDRNAAWSEPIAQSE
jgi:hypothetical protein